MKANDECRCCYLNALLSVKGGLGVQFSLMSLDVGLLQNSLVIDTPRVRKQTRPFSSTKDELAELSEGESSGDDKPKLRRPHDRLNSYGRTECFRVEKNLLVYG